MAITNGTFDTDLSGWTYTSGTSWDASGRALLNLDNNHTAPSLSQTFLIDGTRFKFDYYARAGATYSSVSRPAYELKKTDGTIIASDYIYVNTGYDTSGTIIIDTSAYVGQTATITFKIVYCGDVAHYCDTYMFIDNVVNWNFYGYVSFASTPSGARIYIDNADQGLNTPSTFSYLVAGTHTYKLVFGGYPDRTGSFNIVLGQTATISEVFTLATGIINGTFDTDLSGWSITSGTTWDSGGRALLSLSINNQNPSLSQNFVVNGNTLTFDWHARADRTYYSASKPIYEFKIGTNVVTSGQLYVNTGYDTSGTQTINTSAYVGQTATIVFRMTYCGGPFCDEHMYIDNVAITSVVLGNASFSSTPSGASIFIDNVSKGVNTPSVITNLSAGTHSYKFTRSGYYDKTGSFSVTAGQTSTITDTLTPVTGSINIISTPPGARIFLNNTDQGTNTPNTIANLNPGSYSVKLTLTNYYDWTGTATVTSGQTTTINPTLTPLPGNLSIISTPPGTRIYIDDIDKGVDTPNTISNLVPGSHSVKLTLVNYNDYTTSVTVISNQTTVITPTLSLKPESTKVEASPSFTQPSYIGEIVEIGTLKINWNGTGTIILEKTIVYDRLVLTGPNGIFDHTWTPCGAIVPEGPFNITNIFVPGYNEINIKIYNVCGANIGTVTGSIDITGPITLVCPITPKYSGDTVTLEATPKDGIGPYYVEFSKDGSIIDPIRLGGLDNPIYNAPEDTTITRTYQLTDEDVRNALTGTMNFSVFMFDSCPTAPQTCTRDCVINIGCIAPICNFTVT